MPLGKFSDFDSCVLAMTKKLGSKLRAKKYCGELRARIELGKKPDRKSTVNKKSTVNRKKKYGKS